MLFCFEFTPNSLSDGYLWQTRLPPNIENNLFRSMMMKWVMLVFTLA